MRDQDAWLCFADESGQMLRPPNARTWSRRGHTPLARARAAGSGRISLAGLVCRKAGRRTRLIFRMLVHHGRKGEKKSFREKDFASLLDAVHQQLGGNIVLVRDNYSHHVDATTRELIEKRRAAVEIAHGHLPTDVGEEKLEIKKSTSGQIYSNKGCPHHRPRKIGMRKWLVRPQ
ncbi:transposase [Streptomyces cellulosae]|uniref:Transposase n=1 Tax=Streptomyces cellulosae TaxID=1968 RepID=A0ABW7Y9P2_STRCE